MSEGNAASPDKTGNQIANWALAIMGGYHLFSFFPLLNGMLSTYGDLIVKQFPHVTDNERLVSLVYMSDLIMGLIAATLAAFFSVVFLGFFFHDFPFRFGIATGLIGTLCFAFMIVIHSNSFLSHWSRRPIFFVIDVVSWLALIGICGIAAVLGYKIRAKVLVLWEKYT